MTDYQPTEEDILWAEGGLALLGEGGMMTWPKYATVCQVSHANKTVKVVATLWPDRELFDRSVAVFAAVGYEFIHFYGE